MIMGVPKLESHRANVISSGIGNNQIEDCPCQINHHQKKSIYVVESKFLFAADEVLKANMDLEKVQQELAAKVEKHDAIQNEVTYDFFLYF